MEPSYLYGFVGGCLIGLGSLIAFLATKKVPGISGVFGRILRPAKNDVGWRVAFVAGLIGGAAILFRTLDHAAIYRIPEGRNLIVYGLAGLLVGVGTRLGGGCTSGHGVCGVGMGARDSIVATLVFMVAAFATVFLFNIFVSAS
ncbi:MAG: YeeE/YedE thiosulfate transporter family protein [Verrucomicrobiales bacterium]